MVRHALALGQAGLGGADIHSPVEQPGIGGDDLAIQLNGKLKGDLSFPDRSGSQDHDQGGRW
jgi:hypothetical protein